MPFAMFDCSDLYGSVGPITRISRTIVVGKNASVVRNILYLLSYFIRCSEIYEGDDVTFECYNEVHNNLSKNAEAAGKKAPLLKVRAYSENYVQKVVNVAAKGQPGNTDAAIELAEQMITANSTIVEDINDEKTSSRVRCQSVGGETTSSKDSLDNDLSEVELDDNFDALCSEFKRIPLPRYEIP